MEFKVGDKAVYPGHGVGVVQAVESIDLGVATATVYVLKILDNGMTIKVPIQNASALGMRNVISMTQVDKVYVVLKDRDGPPTTRPGTGATANTSTRSRPATPSRSARSCGIWPCCAPRRTSASANARCTTRPAPC